MTLLPIIGLVIFAIAAIITIPFMLATAFTPMTRIEDHASVYSKWFDILCVSWIAAFTYFVVYGLIEVIF